eukprot:6760572-Prymnesium_polylepis.2
MTNPLPSEQILTAKCSTLLHTVAVTGTNLPRCVALIELREGVALSSKATLDTIRDGLAEANESQPDYSAVLPQHAVFVPHGTLPLTVKGTVMRRKVEKMLADELQAIVREEGKYPSLRQLSGDEGAARTVDSLDLAANAAAKEVRTQTRRRERERAPS